MSSSEPQQPDTPPPGAARSDHPVSGPAPGDPTAGNPTAAGTATTGGPQRSHAVRVVLASLAGTTIEWYEFFIYGTAAALLFDELFFPGDDPVVSALLSMSTFALAFLARPLGGVIFGHFGDRVGRKSMLVITLTMMGAATLAIGLLPTYERIGIAAPILLVLMRVVQGISLGGEYGGAVLMSVEHAASGRRGFFGAIVNTGAPWGMLLANLVFLAVSQLPDEAFRAWGWRLPFLFSVLLIMIGLLIRLKLAESPDFQRAKHQGAVRRAPVAEVVGRYPLRTLLMCLAYVSTGVTFYVGTVFSLSYGEGELAMDRNTLLQLVLASCGVMILGMLFFGWLSDRIGRKGVFLAGTLSVVVVPYLWFGTLDSGSIPLMLLGFAVLFLPYAASYATMPVFFAHVFPASVRYTGMSLGYTLGTVLGSALAPIIATWLLARAGSWTAVAVYMSIAGVVSTLAAVFLRDWHGPRTDAERVVDP